MKTAAVVGSGPNGLAAAVTLAKAGLQVTVYEGSEVIGGGSTSSELLGPGVITDTCSAVHPSAAASPFLRSLGLERHGLRWIHPDAPLAHPLDDGPAALLERSLAATAESLGRDGRTYARLFRPVVQRWERVVDEVFGPVLHVPRAPFALAAFGVRGLWPAAPFARALFRDERARALFAGMAAHAMLPLSKPLTAAFGVLFGAAGHTTGWPVAQGGSQAITDALVAELAEHGGKVITGQLITALDEVRPADLVMLDVTPSQLLTMAGDDLPPRYRRSLARYRYGTAAYKVDYLLDGPVPWRDERCLRAGTVHVGGTMAEVARAEADTYAGRRPERPFVLVAQQSLFDPTRVPAGRQVIWAYGHVPNGWNQPVGDKIDAQIERFAPGFRDRILARAETSPADLQRRNPNYVGGHIGGGSLGGLQLVFRPTPALVPYATPIDGVYLCSSSTPPGGGVHGMCGYHAARAALTKAGMRWTALTA